MYGKELILDLHNCNVHAMTRVQIKNFCEVLCERIDMQKCEFHFWDYEGDPAGYNKAPDHLKGISAIQFLTTSNITIHTLDKMGRVYLNVFSCKKFSSSTVKDCVLEFFAGEIVNATAVTRI